MTGSEHSKAAAGPRSASSVTVDPAVDREYLATPPIGPSCDWPMTLPIGHFAEQLGPWLRFRPEPISRYLSVSQSQSRHYPAVGRWARQRGGNKFKRQPTPSARWGCRAHPPRTCRGRPSDLMRISSSFLYISFTSKCKAALFAHSSALKRRVGQGTSGVFLFGAENHHTASCPASEFSSAIYPQLSRCPATFLISRIWMPPVPRKLGWPDMIVPLPFPLSLSVAY